MKTRLIVASCLILVLCGCGKKTVQNTRFSGRDYVLQFPESWEVNKSRVMGSDVIGLSPLEGADDTFRENINVVLENIPGTFSEKDYLDATLKNMCNGLGLPADAEFKKTRIGHTDAYHLPYAMQMGQHEMDNDVYLVIHKKSAYILTCSNAKGKREAFQATMDAILGTFQLK
jgi:hypothetical protein